MTNRMGEVKEINGHECRATNTSYQCWRARERYNHDDCDDFGSFRNDPNHYLYGGCDCPCHGRRMSPEWNYVIAVFAGDMDVSEHPSKE